MKKVLITGATGLVGSHLTAELLSRLQQGDTTYGTPVVVARSDASWGKLDWVLLRRGVATRLQQRTTAQLEYLDDCRRLLHDERPQVVFHCAARIELGKTPKLSLRCIDLMCPLGKGIFRSAERVPLPAMARIFRACQREPLFPRRKSGQNAA